MQPFPMQMQMPGAPGVAQQQLHPQAQAQQAAIQAAARAAAQQQRPLGAPGPIGAPSQGPAPGLPMGVPVPRPGHPGMPMHPGMHVLPPGAIPPGGLPPIGMPLPPMHDQKGPMMRRGLAPEELKAKADKVGPNAVFLPRNTNQALGIGQFAIDFISGKLGKGPDDAVFRRAELFHTDATLCGMSSLALRTNAPSILRDEALEYQAKEGCFVFGSKKKLAVEKVVAANCSAVREWDANGTVFGYNPKFGHLAGEFGHNDYYPVVVAATQTKGLDGRATALGFILLDEIRGRLCEVFPLKNYNIDHVVHGAIASAATFGAMMGATAKQIEYAIGMFVSHYIPFRSIRAGHQLSDSKGASAGISAEAAVLCMLRAMRGFVGPADIFRNPEAIFRKFEPTNGDSPFDLVLTHSGSDFAVMGMHFKLGIYEHQSAGALQALIDAVTKHPKILATGVKSMKIRSYQPAFGIIGDPAKRDPHTRQSADHSMVYIVATMLKKALVAGESRIATTSDEVWQQLMLMPEDYSHSAIFDPTTRLLMQKVMFEHGGKEYDDRYPDGIPTSVVITDNLGNVYDSGMVMYPAGHARNDRCNLDAILSVKFQKLAQIGVKNVKSMMDKLTGLVGKTAKHMQDLYNYQINFQDSVDEDPVQRKARREREAREAREKKDKRDRERERDEKKKTAKPAGMPMAQGYQPGMQPPGHMPHMVGPGLASLPPVGGVIMQLPPGHHGMLHMPPGHRPPGMPHPGQAPHMAMPPPGHPAHGQQLPPPHMQMLVTPPHAQSAQAAHLAHAAQVAAQAAAHAAQAGHHRARGMEDDERESKKRPAPAADPKTKAQRAVKRARKDAAAAAGDVADADAAPADD